MIIVIDSSTLISLALSDGTGMLKKVNADLICPEEVYHETVIEGSIGGHPDAIAIKGVFDDEIIKVETIERKMRFPGISKADCSVLALGVERKASYLLVNDTKLARRAAIEGFGVNGSPDMYLRMYEKEEISIEEYKGFINKLKMHGRLSEENAELYLKAVM